MRVSPWLSEEIEQQEYDLVLGSCGYESRARYIFESRTIETRSAAIYNFASGRVLEYKKNEEFYRSRQFVFVEATQHTAAELITHTVNTSVESKASKLHFLVDISSMSRLLIASTIVAIENIAHRIPNGIDVTFCYATAEFGDIPRIDGPIVVDGPAISSLAGWPAVPGAPLGLVIGIGYEEDLALGIIEELEAANVWAFRPSGHDPRYEAAIIEKNKGLFEQIPPRNMIRYPLFDPYALYSLVEPLLGIGKMQSRIIVVPLGPKIFALASCLAALRHLPDVGYWRVSNGDALQPVERKANGTVIGLRVRFCKGSS